MSSAKRYSDLHRVKIYEAYFFMVYLGGFYSPLGKTHELLPALRQSKICKQMPAVTPKTFQILGECRVFNIFNDAKLLPENTKDFTLSEKL